jgi:hypothetical protein
MNDGSCHTAVLVDCVVVVVATRAIRVALDDLGRIWIVCCYVYCNWIEHTECCRLLRGSSALLLLVSPLLVCVLVEVDRFVV